VFAAGNAYPLQLMLAAVTPMVKAIADSGADLFNIEKEAGNHVVRSSAVLAELVAAAPTKKLAHTTHKPQTRNVHRFSLTKRAVKKTVAKTRRTNVLQ